jgi:hypothetical protein
MGSFEEASLTGLHSDATHAPPRQSWPQAPQLLGSFVVSLQPPPELLELAAELPTLDAPLLDAPPALALPPLSPEVPALEAAPPAPPSPALDVALLEPPLALPCAASITTTEPQPVGPAMAAVATLAARLASQTCSRDSILIGLDLHVASAPATRPSHGAGARSRKFHDALRARARARH